MRAKHGRAWPAALVVSIVAAAALALSQLAAWRASVDGILPDRRDAREHDENEVVVVLGFRGSGSGRGGANGIQRWRTRIAIRSAGESGQLIFTGAATRGARSEAAVMAAYAYRRGVSPERITLEEKSRTTRENIRNSIPLVEDAGVTEDAGAIRIASDPFHARRARRYLWGEAPALARRLRRTRESRWRDAPLNACALVYELVRSRRAQSGTGRGAAGPT